MIQKIVTEVLNTNKADRDVLLEISTKMIDLVVGMDEIGKSHLEKLKLKTSLIWFYDSKGMVHKEFVPLAQSVTSVFYLGVLMRLVYRIRCIRTEDCDRYL